MKRPSGPSGMEPAAVENNFSDWTEDDLHAALDEGLSNPGSVFPSGPANEVMEQLLAEWIRRDPDTAVAWFEAIPSDSRKIAMAAMLARSWPKERAEEGLDYVFKHHDTFKTKNLICYSPIMVSAMDAAALRGPAAIDAMLVKLRENHLGTRYGSGWQFPQGFDFAALAELPEASRILGKGDAFYAEAWFKQDRNEAFEYLMGGNEARGGDLTNSLYLYACQLPDNSGSGTTAERLNWLAGKLDEFDPVTRRQVALHSVDVMDTAPAELARFAAALTDPEDRQAVNAAAVNKLMKGGIEPTLSFLDAVSDTGQRLDLLENATVDMYRTKFFVPGQQALLRERLAAWNTPVERIEAIVRHLKEAQR
ncbi:MAG: hypothetical protein ABI162_07990 [Luteolibacter sp.]